MFALAARIDGFGLESPSSVPRRRARGVFRPLHSTRRQSIGGIVGSFFSTSVAKPSNNNKRNKSIPLTKIEQVFPGALRNDELVADVTRTLRNAGCTTSSTLLATSLCCDEVNRPLEHAFEKVFGDPFVMGGLAGFPFAGLTGVQAMASHVPDGGSCLIIFGPHVGIDKRGTVGSLDRRGRQQAGACCGSAAAAAKVVTGKEKNRRAVWNSRNKALSDLLTSQQEHVNEILADYSDVLNSADDPMIAVPYCLFDAQNQLMDLLVDKGLDSMGLNGKLALLGGIQINTDVGEWDYFLPLRFEVRDSSGEMLVQADGV